MVIVELFALLIVVVLAICGLALPRFAGRSFSRGFRRLANHRGLSITLTGVWVLAIEAGIGLLLHMPLPALHDEFAYLLASDTFANGRLANETHPMWEHFESYGIIHQPTYQSKYPPGQGMSLAVGQRLFQRPIVGVWLTLALACAAVTWMAYGWLPPRWALLAGLLVACNGRVLRFWGATYMGGGVALLGGALVFGALPRLIRDGRARDGILLALGLGILANSRPYEGLVATLPVAAVLLVAWLSHRRRHDQEISWARAMAPAVLILMGIAGWIGHYNYRVTGDAFRMPYQVWQETYSSDSIWNTLFRDMEDRIPTEGPPRAIGSGPTQADWQMWFRERSNLAKKLISHWAVFVGVVLTPLLFTLPWVCRQRRMLLAAGIVGIVLVAIFLQNTHGHPHYAAPVAGLVAVLLAQGTRHLRLWRWGSRPVGRRLAALMLALFVVGFAGYLALDWVPQPVHPQLTWSLDRARLVETLSAGDEEHVVVVRHPPASITGIEWNQWVYNHADIDASQVIWARDLGAERNRTLLDYFSQRRAWLLDLSQHPPALRPLGRRAATAVATDEDSLPRKLAGGKPAPTGTERPTGS